MFLYWARQYIILFAESLFCKDFANKVLRINNYFLSLWLIINL